MRESRSYFAKAAVALSLSAVGIFGLTGVANAYTVVDGSAQACGDTSAYDKVSLSSLPSQATDTYDLILSDGPFPYPKKDGSTFTNTELILPDCSSVSSSYYKEYTVITPGASTRGTRRLVEGNGDSSELFYTNDHYTSFAIVDVNS
jgi:guanyl-specific ribonuclease Sa